MQKIIKLNSTALSLIFFYSFVINFPVDMRHLVSDYDLTNELQSEGLSFAMYRIWRKREREVFKY